MLKFLIIFSLLSLILISANAQVGCIDANGFIHTNYQNASKGYTTSPAVPPSSGCSFVVTSGTCKINSASGFFLGDQGIQECPIDDYIWVMITLLGGISFYVIRKKNRFGIIS